MHRENYFRCVKNVEMNFVEVNALPTNIPTLRCFLFVKPCSVCMFVSLLVFVLIFGLPTNILAMRCFSILKPVIPFLFSLIEYLHRTAAMLCLSCVEYFEYLEYLEYFEYF